jgi:WD40 repeat protein
MILGFPKWIDHSDMPIWSIDAQPKGYRLLTGGGDNKVKIWNILPIISAKHETREDDD